VDRDAGKSETLEGRACHKGKKTTKKNILVCKVYIPEATSTTRGALILGKRDTQEGGVFFFFCFWFGGTKKKGGVASDEICQKPGIPGRTTLFYYHLGVDPTSNVIEAFRHALKGKRITGSGSRTR